MPAIPRKQLFLFNCLRWLTSHVVKSPFGRLKWIYRYMDSYNKFVATFSVCSKGCSHCCEIDVYISSLEAAYIAENIGVPANFDSPYSKNHFSPCPFLSKEKSCSIYQFRPFNCRTFHTLDHPKYCVSGESHAVYGASGYGYGASVLQEIAHVITQLNGNHPMKDIRDFFKTANPAVQGALRDKAAQRPLPPR